MATAMPKSEEKYLESQTIPASAPADVPQPPLPAYTASHPPSGVVAPPAHNYPPYYAGPPPPQQLGTTQPVLVLRPIREKSVAEGYLLLLFLGFVGAHHFYLRRPGWGVFYLFTLGGFGCGYLFDFFRMPCLVKRANSQIVAARAGQAQVEENRRVQCDDAYVLWFPMGGFLGLHHFYLNRPGWGILYFCTLGCFGLGWILDGFRLSSIVEDYNNRIGKPIVLSKKRRLDDVYITWFPPLGLLGFHHFYLGRPCWGTLYAFTFGLLGLGWLVDMFRIPSLTNEYNRGIEAEAAAVNGPAVVTVTTSDGSAPAGGYDNLAHQTCTAGPAITHPGGPAPGNHYQGYVPGGYPPTPYNYNTFPADNPYPHGQDATSNQSNFASVNFVQPPAYSLEDPASGSDAAAAAAQNHVNEKLG